MEDWQSSLFAAADAYQLIGGIIGGIFTPTEGAAVAAFYALILGVFITREISLLQLFEVFRKAALKSAIILFLVGAAVSFASLVRLKVTPQLVSGFILNITTDPLMLFLVVVLFLLAICTIMDAGPAILILAPTGGAMEQFRRHAEPIREWYLERFGGAGQEFLEAFEVAVARSEEIMESDRALFP